MRIPFAAILLFSALRLLAPAAAANAQVAPPQSDTALFDFQISAQPLPDALAELGRRTGLRITANRGELGAAQGAAVSGRMTAPEALRVLLEGSGFSALWVDGMVVIHRAGSVRATRELGRIIVRDRAGRRRYGVRSSSTATRTELSLRDTPQAVSVVSKELIADQSMQSMADVLRYVPGATMGQGEGHRDAPVLRGNTSTADFFVDGVRDDAQYLRDLYNVERVETLKGANAMVFGRGGGGGVINRVGKEAQWLATRSVSAEGGSWAHRRATADLGGEVSSRAALRVTGMGERSARFRDGVNLTRYGVNPTTAVALSDRTTLRAGFELFTDRRTVDRGIPSFAGRPSSAAASTFFGDPDASRSTLHLQSASVGVEHLTGVGVTLRSRTRASAYEKYYANVYPGAVDSTESQVALLAYNSDIRRDNLFTQNEATLDVSTGRVRHSLLAGMELGTQGTDNLRRTGRFANGKTSISVPFARPTVQLPVVFSQSATDADNRVTARVAAAYVQDQVQLAPGLQAVAGLRYDRFSLDYRNNRDGSALSRVDRFLSPRVGVVVKPSEPLSLYGTYSVSFLPSAGDQFASLSATTVALEPEQFVNREVGAKWEPHPSFMMSVAAYRLDRSNSAAPDPADITRLVQTGRQRSTGVELDVSGAVTPRWSVSGGLAAQRAEIVERTTAAVAGTSVPLVPRRSASLWNRVQLSRAVGAGLGVIRQGSSFAAIDNRVTLPAFTRADGALYVLLGRSTRAQVNVENVLDVRYYGTSHGNDNILPGAPRTVRLTLATDF